MRIASSTWNGVPAPIQRTTMHDARPTQLYMVN